MQNSNRNLIQYLNFVFTCINVPGWCDEFERLFNLHIHQMFCKAVLLEKLQGAQRFPTMESGIPALKLVCKKAIFQVAQRQWLGRLWHLGAARAQP